MEFKVRVENAELCNGIDQQVTGTIGEGEVDRSKWNCSLPCISFLLCANRVVIEVCKQLGSSWPVWVFSSSIPDLYSDCFRVHNE